MFTPDKRPWMANPDTLRTSGMTRAWEDMRTDMENYRVTIERDITGEMGRTMFDIRNRLQDYWAEKYAADPDEYEDALSVAKAVLDWTQTMTSFQDLARVLEARQQTASDAGVTLSTIHKAKGLEFDAVLIYDCGEATFIKESPNMEEDDMDEEFRLHYVASTRAKKYLTIGTSSLDPTGGMICRHLRSQLHGVDPLDWPGDTRRDPFWDPRKNPNPVALSVSPL
jgi:DNA helicase-2/ATP-dependent DNA helicase PcrA